MRSNTYENVLRDINKSREVLESKKHYDSSLGNTKKQLQASKNKQETKDKRILPIIKGARSI